LTVTERRKKEKEKEKNPDMTYLLEQVPKQLKTCSEK
jgi:hypothetical protein